MGLWFKSTICGVLLSCLGGTVKLSRRSFLGSAASVAIASVLPNRTNTEAMLPAPPQPLSESRSIEDRMRVRGLGSIATRSEGRPVSFTRYR